MQEEIERKTVALVFKAGKLTGEELSKAMKAFVDFSMNKITSEKVKSGEMTVGDLVSKGNGVKTLDVNPESIALFKKVATKYKVDFAVKKTEEDKNNKYIVFFQAKDTDVIKACFKEYMDLNEKQAKKKHVKEEIKKNKEKVKENKTKEKSKEKNREKVKSL